jgi:hypothetical protein
MLSTVRKNIEDTTSSYRFSDAEIYVSLTDSQQIIVNAVDNNYLSELRYIDTSKTFSNGVLAISSLSKTVLGGDEGIICIKTSYGYFSDKPVKVDELAILNNTFMTGNNMKPVIYVFNGYINIIPSTIILADVYYYRVPETIDGSTSSLLNQILHNAVVNYTSSILLIIDDKPERGMIFQKLLDNELILLNQKYEKKKKYEIKKIEERE